MEKLEQIDLNCVSAMECAKFEVCAEKFENKLDKLIDIKNHEKIVKSRISKLFRKSKLNAKYIEQLVPIESIERQRMRRDYGIF